jgi:acetyl esterase/lipase
VLTFDLLLSQSQSASNLPPRANDMASFSKSLFGDYDVETIAYKYVDGDPIMLDVMVPKRLSPGKHPVNLRFHGGFLVMGDRDMVEITPPRILQHALDEGIVIVTPDYRLLPESSGVDILDDIEAVWRWCIEKLQDTVHRMTGGKAVADMEKIMTSGESAGSYPFTAPIPAEPKLTQSPLFRRIPRHPARAFSRERGSRCDRNISYDRFAGSVL